MWYKKLQFKNVPILTHGCEDVRYSIATASLKLVRMKRPARTERHEIEDDANIAASSSEARATRHISRIRGC